MRSLFFAITAILLMSGCATVPLQQLPTVSDVDLNRYSGKWFEIARYENRFEKGCESATADYKLKNNYVSVTNRCYNDIGEEIGKAEGRAYSVNKSGNSKLRVSFFRPFYGDYWIVMLADDYRFSVVGDPNRNYLWILARKNVLSEEDKNMILSFLPTIGYDPSKLYWSKPLEKR
jgi:apolipoprotein D and lipocalin family protein